MRRLLSLLVAILLVPAVAGAAPTVDAADIELVAHDAFGNPQASGTTPFFAGGTDLAFDGDFVYAAEQAGSGDREGGVHIYDVSDPDGLQEVGFVDCPASQNDVAVVEPGIIALAYHSETGAACRANAIRADGSSTGSTAGVRLYDVSDLEERGPVALGMSPPLPGGTHTLTVHPSGDYIYASPGGIANGGGVEQILDISDRDGPFKVYEFKPNETGCHDLTFFTSADDRPMAVCVGTGESQLWDVSDPTAPEIVSHIVNPLIFFHHSAEVTDDGRYLVIGDEAYGAHDCEGGPTGALFLYDLAVPEAPLPLSYFGIDRSHADAPASTNRVDWCTAHIFDFIPGTRLLVTSWYSGGINIVDWSDPLAPREVAHYRTDGEYAASEVTNYWSSYWHNGRIYGNDRVRGLDALRWTAYEERFPPGSSPSPGQVTAFARSLPSTPSGWYAGRLDDAPNPAQPSLPAGPPALSSYSCRLSAG